ALSAQGVHYRGVISRFFVCSLAQVERQRHVRLVRTSGTRHGANRPAPRQGNCRQSHHRDSPRGWCDIWLRKLPNQPVGAPAFESRWTPAGLQNRFGSERQVDRGNLRWLPNGDWRRPRRGFRPGDPSEVGLESLRLLSPERVVIDDPTPRRRVASKGHIPSEAFLAPIQSVNHFEIVYGHATIHVVRLNICNPHLSNLSTL